MADDDMCECGHVRDEHGRGHECDAVNDDEKTVCGCIHFEQAEAPDAP